MVLQEPINAGLGHKAAVRVREVDGELTRRQVRLLKGQIDDRRPDLVRDLVPDPPRSRLAIFQSFDPALLVTTVPVVERRPRDPDRRQWTKLSNTDLTAKALSITDAGGRQEAEEIRIVCPTDRERRLFPQFDELELSDSGYLMKRPPHPRERFF